MADVTAVDLVRGLYDYHWWANRRLFHVAAGLGEVVANREVGPQFSFPTVQRMLNHLYGGDAIWLSRWQGDSPSSVPGADIPSLAVLRERWDAVESEQRSYLAALRPDDLGRTVDYKTTMVSRSGWRCGRYCSTWPIMPRTTGVRSPQCSRCSVALRRTPASRPIGCWSRAKGHEAPKLA